MTVGSNLGAPGTRVTKSLGPVSELLLYVWQAIIGALALDTALALVMCSWLIIGWLAIPLLFGAACFLITVVVLTFSEISGDKLRLVVGNLWLFGLLSGGIFGWRWHGAISAGLHAVAEQLWSVFELPWYIYVIAGVVLFLLALRSWKAALVALFGAWIGYVLFATDSRTWALAWHSLKWLLLPYLWPFIGFAVLLAFVMAKEMLWPSLEWTFKPVSLTELREVGLFGLWMPKLLGGPEPPPEQQVEQVIRVDVRDENGDHKIDLIPGGDEARAFYAAVHGGESFSERTARVCTLSRKKWENAIRDVFIERGWACWVNDDYPQQGVELLRDGWLAIEHIVLAGTTPSPTG
jgi:hypothetical protein